jgi:hypothetical protein
VNIHTIHGGGADNFTFTYFGHWNIGRGMTTYNLNNDGDDNDDKDGNDDNDGDDKHGNDDNCDDDDTNDDDDN